MNFLHELSEPTKRFFDLTAAASAVTALTLSNAALAISCVAGLLSITWYGVRLFDRFKYGRSGD
jgi:hypothetical protein